MAYTDSYQVIARYLCDKLIASKVDLNLLDVFYGDQDRIPRTPTACVEPGGKVRELNGAPRRTLVTMENFIIVYHATIASPMINMEAVDIHVESIEAFIHADPWFQTTPGDGSTDQVISSLVTKVESGFMSKREQIYRASRLTVEAMSQVQLPNAF